MPPQGPRRHRIPPPSTARQSDPPTFGPCGQVIAAESFNSPAHNRLGHQGLFADRYDTDAPAPDLAVDADLMYYARNRDYSPRLGRWVHADVFGTGQATLTVSGVVESAGWLDQPSFDGLSAFRDGLNRFAFVRSSPTTQVDPEGTFALFGDSMGSLLLRNALFGGTSGALFGGIGSKAGGGSFADGAWRGAVAGAAGGAVGAYAGSLFVSAQGTLLGATGTVASGALGGGVSSGINSRLDGNDWNTVWQDTAWGALTGSAVSGVSLAVVERAGLKAGMVMPDWLEQSMTRGFQEFGAGMGVAYTEFRDKFLKSMGLR